MRLTLSDKDANALMEEKAVSFGTIELVRNTLIALGFKETNVEYTGKFSHIATFSHPNGIVYLSIF